ncbi:FMN-binding protein [Microbacterium schleiferi]|uniref:FMN-binding protein n=1 Tax=Microbacterium schleiferi TaxID=69362 RepID=A0A7S8RIP1_9MICO|nr:FMN-binding protein [Microbacterium schleiferi]QPE05631.1 FMN-binding protein [Microbacterium schleiferi]
MKRIIYGLLATLSGVVLLFSYRTSLEAVMPITAENTSGTATTPSAPAAAAPATGSSTPSASASPSASDSGSGTGSGAATTPAASGLADGTFTGDAARTRYGNVQVAITISGGTITDIQVPQYPNSNREDQQINARALPVLISETASAQSASISMVSGATYTSQGYTQSLQSALDQAQQ